MKAQIHVLINLLTTMVIIVVPMLSLYRNAELAGIPLKLN